MERTHKIQAVDKAKGPRSAKTIESYSQKSLQLLDIEMFYTYCLDVDGAVLASAMHFGDKNVVRLDETEVLDFITDHKTAKVVFVHNHPSGIYPSEGDIETTLFFKDCLAWLGIELLDHLVIRNKLAPFTQVFKPDKKSFSLKYDCGLKGLTQCCY